MNPKTDYGVDAYTVLYRTVGANSRLTVASGLVVLPRDGGTAVDPMVFEHGTRSARTGVATRDRTNDDWYTALLIASDGYGAVAVDLLTDGYRKELLNPGDGTCAGWHPDVPVRLFAATGDEQVTFASSRTATITWASPGCSAGSPTPPIQYSAKWIR